MVIERMAAAAIRGGVGSLLALLWLSTNLPTAFAATGSPTPAPPVAAPTPTAIPAASAAPAPVPAAAASAPPAGTHTAVETAPVASPPPPAHAAHAPHWSYAGSEGPEHWAAIDTTYGVCAKGKHQSPIDLVAAAPRDLANPTLAYSPAPATLVDNGHTVQVGFPRGPTMTLDGEPYRLLQLHFHAPAEHAIAGKRAPLEAHLVHRRVDGTFAVVGVMIVEGQPNAVLDPLLAALPLRVDHELTLAQPFDPERLLPRPRATYRYSGSLTTPPCSEGVRWMVMATPIQASREQIAALTAALHGGNSRPLQPKAGRELLLDATP